MNVVGYHCEVLLTNAVSSVSEAADALCVGTTGIGTAQYT